MILVKYRRIRIFIIFFFQICLWGLRPSFYWFIHTTQTPIRAYDGKEFPMRYLFQVLLATDQPTIASSNTFRYDVTIDILKQMKMALCFRWKTARLQNMFEKVPWKFVIVEAHEFTSARKTLSMWNLFEEILAKVQPQEASTYPWRGLTIY